MSDCSNCKELELEMLGLKEEHTIRVSALVRNIRGLSLHWSDELERLRAKEMEQTEEIMKLRGLLDD